MGDDSARRLILARRARFVAAALASVAATAGTAIGTEACTGGGGESEEIDGGAGDGASKPSPGDDASPQPCLDIVVPEEDGGADAGPQPCLFAPLDDAG